MTETYRKQGATVRYENGVIVHVQESGVAVDDGETFTCYPSRSAVAPATALGSESGGYAAALLENIPFTIERLIITHGFATHDCDGRVWSEETKRLHLSITHENLRILIDDERDIAPAANALQRLKAEREPPPRLRLAPNIAAALTPALVHLAPPNIRVAQVAGGIDGKGFPIVEAYGDWPNWYRPSYRVRPVRMPLNLRVTCDVNELEEGRPRAVALLAPPDGLTLRVLIDDGDEAWPSTVRVTRIDAVADDAVWYPYGGGSFGAEMML